MTVGTMAALSIHHRFSRNEHDLIQSDLNLPNNYSFESIVKIKVVLTLIIETLGAGVLYILFTQSHTEDALWQAIFHSVSAFCTAGLSLFPDNLAGFNHNYPVQFVIIGLSLMGALGFIVFSDIYRMSRHRQRKLTFTSKVILFMMALLIILGTALLFFTDSSLVGYTSKDRFFLSLFHTLSAVTTAGFNTLPIDNFVPASLFLISILMIIGASPTGTGGGLKATTVAVVYSKMITTFKQHNKVVLFDNEIPEFRVNLAMSSTVFYFSLIYTGIFLLLYLENQPFMNLFFEVISAIGTVGLSTGITSELSNIGKLLVCVLMFIGRITPLAIGIMIFNKLREEDGQSHEDISL